MDFTLEAGRRCVFPRHVQDVQEMSGCSWKNNLWPRCSAGACAGPRLFSNLPRPSPQVHAGRFNVHGWHVCSQRNNTSIGGEWELLVMVCRKWKRNIVFECLAFWIHFSFPWFYWLPFYKWILCIIELIKLKETFTQKFKFCLHPFSTNADEKSGGYS